MAQAAQSGGLFWLFNLLPHRSLPIGASNPSAKAANFISEQKVTLAKANTTTVLQTLPVTG